MIIKFFRSDGVTALINQFLIKIYKLTVGDRRIGKLSTLLVRNLPVDIETLLDFGCGTGQITFNISCARSNLKVTGLDTLIRSNTFIKVVQYDGNVIPFKASNFDALLAIDVIHHTENPRMIFEDIVRVSNKYIIIKDHIANSILDRLILKFMDYVGNRAYGVSLPYNYLSQDQWNNLFKDNNLEIIKIIYTLNLYPNLFDWIFGKKLHFLAILKKK